MILLGAHFFIFDGQTPARWELPNIDFVNVQRGKNQGAKGTPCGLQPFIQCEFPIEIYPVHAPHPGVAGSSPS